jgi:hypothetical protein
LRPVREEKLMLWRVFEKKIRLISFNSMLIGQKKFPVLNRKIEISGDKKTNGDKNIFIFLARSF